MSQDPRELELRIIQSLERGVSVDNTAEHYKVSKARVHFVAIKQGLAKKALIWGGFGIAAFTAGYLTRRWVKGRRRR